MDSSDHVGGVLRRVLALSLAPVAAGTCGSIDAGGFEPVACRAIGETSYLDGLKPRVAADYLELRARLRGASHAPHTIETSGTRCARATDPAACEAKIAASSSTDGFALGQCVQLCPQNVLIVSARDDVDTLSSKEEIKAWLGRVDSPTEAVLAAALEGYDVSCGDDLPGGVRRVDGGYEVLATRLTSLCAPVETTLYVLHVSADGDVGELASEVIRSTAGACIGRRAPGLVERAASGATVLGAWLAQVAQLEAASVRAFDVLRRELVHHGAPRPLIERAGAARRDEVRHARAMGALAVRHGGRPRAPRVEPQPPRSLEEIAVENAAEGCVRETFGALVGMWQARFAGDRAVRRVMQGIARDEARHASLAWALDRWARAQLSPAARRRADEARRLALDEIAAEARRGPPPDLVRWAGLPGPRAARRLATHLARSVPALAAA
ncbi:ferritin [Sorangium cellulosum]|uniref:Ferritin n=1 Tax=Sorangium cellulosum TaxID=56 RepID=A0A4V0NE94_SORCE|nr:ferritin-like domain-containing protein [Sorangium cellulosum]AUX25382.1 ferritin [Sorangium cellulosum]